MSTNPDDILNQPIAEILKGRIQRSHLGKPENLKKLREVLEQANTEVDRIMAERAAAKEQTSDAEPAEKVAPRKRLRLPRRVKTD